MKRSLLGGAALLALGAVGLSAGPAAAQLELTITGSVEPEFGFISEDQDSTTGYAGAGGGVADVNIAALFPAGASTAGFTSSFSGALPVTIPAANVGTIAANPPTTQTSRRAYASTTRFILRINADGTADNGLQYGVRVRFDDADGGLCGTTGQVYGQNALRTRCALWIRELWGYARGGWGEVRAGESPIAYQLLTYTIPTGSMPGNIGVLGSWDLYPSFSAGTFDPNIGASLLTNTGNAHPSGITYLLSDYHGFSFGLTYAPTTQGAERIANVNELNGGFSDVVSVAANYTREFAGLTFGISAGGNFAHAEDAAVGVARHDLQEWTVGAQVSTPIGPGTFTLGGFYQNSGRGGMLETAVAAGNTNQAQHWGAGVLYETGPWGFQANYVHFSADPVGSIDTPVNSTTGFGTRDVAESFAVGGGVSYNVAPGLTPYVNLVYFNADSILVSNPAINGVSDFSNEGVVGTVGVTFAF